MDGEDEATCPSCSLIVKVIYDKVTYTVDDINVILSTWLLMFFLFDYQDEYMKSEEVAYIPAPTSKEATTAWHEQNNIRTTINFISTSVLHHVPLTFAIENINCSLCDSYSCLVALSLFTSVMDFLNSALPSGSLTVRSFFFSERSVMKDLL